MTKAKKETEISMMSPDIQKPIFIKLEKFNYGKIYIAAICLSICLGLNCCVYQEGGGKVYEATASTEAGVMFIKLYNVKYICEGVYGIFWTDFYRSKKGSFAIDVSYEKITLPTGEAEPDKKRWFPDPTGITGGAIRFKPLKQEYVDIFGLKPNFSWWEKNGSLVFTVIILILVAKAFHSSQKTKGPVSWWAVAMLMAFILLFVILLRIASTN